MNPSLAIWVGHQRWNYNANKLSPERIEKLNEVGFGWDPIEAQWLECYLELKDHGDTLVPQRYSSNPSLGSWVRNQRED
jgi:hypothetical protein